MQTRGVSMTSRVMHFTDALVSVLLQNEAKHFSGFVSSFSLSENCSTREKHVFFSDLIVDEAKASSNIRTHLVVFGKAADSILCGVLSHYSTSVSASLCELSSNLPLSSTSSLLSCHHVHVAFLQTCSSQNTILCLLQAVNIHGLIDMRPLHDDYNTLVHPICSRSHERGISRSKSF